ncbi:hypothetical protein SDC9_178190 [bioreactor metagenome]|uniref:GP-PDE domain-containing protein n=1 Tax=bioreactor metagenome TaxID=1076179 RepID=A0A645GYA2_9ZZZZ
MSGDDRFLKTIYTVDPKMRRCVGAGGDAWGIVDRAIEMKCEKVQLFKPFFNKEMVDKAHANGIVCNVFFADDPEEAIKYLDMGVDTILTNNFLAVSQAVDQYVAGGK